MEQPIRFSRRFGLGPDPAGFHVHRRSIDAFLLRKTSATRAELWQPDATRMDSSDPPHSARRISAVSLGRHELAFYECAKPDRPRVWLSLFPRRAVVENSSYRGGCRSRRLLHSDGATAARTRVVACSFCRRHKLASAIRPLVFESLPKGKAIRWPCLFDAELRAVFCHHADGIDGRTASEKRGKK